MQRGSGGTIARAVRGRNGKDRRAPPEGAPTSSSPGFEEAQVDDQLAALSRAVEEDLEALRREPARPKPDAAVSLNGRHTSRRPVREPRLDRDAANRLFRTIVAWTAWVAVGAIVGILVVYAGR